MRAHVRLLPGCKLYYDCPLGGGDYQSEQYFKAHRGKHATFVGYVEKLVSVLNLKGRLPGHYLDPKGIIVQFEGEVARELQAEHFIVLDTKAELVEPSDTPERLGDLPHPVLFYPGDTVRFKKKPQAHLSDEPRKVQGVFLGGIFIKGNVPRYEVMETDAEMAQRLQQLEEKNASKKSATEAAFQAMHHMMRRREGWNTADEDIELVSRGNVWALYNNPAALSFDLGENELAFWAELGISRYLSDEAKERVLQVSRYELQRSHGLSIENAYRLFEVGEADVIEPAFSNPGEGPRYSVKRLHDCWSEHRERVRAFTRRLWAHQVKVSAA